ncbi:DNA topoisomerase 1 [Rhodocyclaceae bacterium]|nr:DNA topoisomerase 1 [Rhodocyclaceae bacterium]
MPNRLVIVESPNKTAKIEEMYPDVKALATVGHICDLPTNPKEGIGIDPQTLAGQYELTKDSSRHTDGTRVVAKLKKYIADHPGLEIYLGTDDDREGESIAAFAVKYLKLRQYKRMKFNAITKEKIDEGFRTAGPIDWPAVASREARRAIDRIIGYTVSPLLGRIIKQRGVSAGRVQTAVEALVIERERKIRNHKVQPYYTVEYDMGGWTAQWQVPATTAKRTGPRPNSEFDIDDSTPRCFDRAAAERAAGFRALQVVSCTDTMEDRLPPPPLHTVAMIQVANRILGWAADKTMQVAQKLFEGDGSGHGHITYHRTDSPNIDPGPAEEIRAWLRAKNLPVPDKANRWANKNKQAQEGHEAIRPAYLDVEEAGATDEQRALYKIIRDRAIYSQLAPARYAVKRIGLVDPIKGDHSFSATARTLVSPGWLSTPAANAPILQDDDEKKDEAPAVSLPTLTRNTVLNARGARVGDHTTKAPPRYTIRTLTAKLEKLSIGRPATIATILKSMQTKGFVGKDGKLQATPISERCYDVLYPRFAFAHVGYTAELEQALDQIASQQLDGLALTRAVWDRINADCAALSQGVGLAPAAPAAAPA